MRISDEDRLKGSLLVLLAAVLHAAVPVAGKYAQQSMNTATYVFLWAFFAVLFTQCYFLLFGMWRVAMRQIAVHWKTFLIMGLCQAGASWTFFYGVVLIDPTVAAFFGRASAIFSLVLGVLFLRERLNAMEAAGIALAIIGALVITWDGGQVKILGMLMVVASTLFFALFTFTAKIRVSGIHPMVLVSGGSTVSAALLFVSGIGAGTLEFNQNVEAVSALAAGAFFGGFLGIGTFYRGLKYIGFAVGSALRSAQVVFVALLSWFTLRMQPDPQDWAGGLVIIAGVLLLTLAGRRRRSTLDVPSQGPAGS